MWRGERYYRLTNTQPDGLFVGIGLRIKKRKGEKYMFRRDVQNLADVLNLCLRRNGLETPLLQHRLVNAWDRVVGPGVVAYTGEKFIKNQTLMVKIKNPALRQDLSMMKQRLITRLNGEVGSMIITDIKFY